MKFSTRYIGLLAIPAILLTGCQTDEDSHDFENKVFISASTFAKQVRVQTDEKVDELTSEVSVSMAEPSTSDVEVIFRAAPELLDKYRLGYYDESAVLLPEGHYDLGDMKALISAGNVTSAPVEFRFTGLTGLDYSCNYVLPVSIASASGVDILESARTMYFVVKEASLINVVADMSNNCAWPEWGNFDEVADMETFTMEALVKANAFNNESSVHTIMGIEDVFLIRVGDVTIPKNQLQIASAKYDEVNNTTVRMTVTNASMKLNVDRWYHIAVTFDHGIVNAYIDGKLKGTGDFTGEGLELTSVNFKVPHSDEMDDKPRCFWIGYSYDSNRPFDGSISEVRMWNRALTAEEINSPNHFYKIDTKDESKTQGLVAYWKLNGLDENQIKDYSGYGNNLSSASAIVWKEVSLPEKE